MPRTARQMIGATTFALLVLLLLALLLLGACRDKEKMAAEKAGPAIERLLPIIERDTKQVREGLPEGEMRRKPYVFLLACQGARTEFVQLHAQISIAE